MNCTNANPPHAADKNVMLRALGALGAVFCDIGTSPLYTVQTVFLAILATPDNVIGAISAIFRLLNLTVTLKYAIVIMRANNRGEGGIMALTALAFQSTLTLTRPWWKTMTMMIGKPSPLTAICRFMQTNRTPQSCPCLPLPAVPLIE